MKYPIISYKNICKLSPDFNSIVIEPTPIDEPCLQVGSPEYNYEQAVLESTAHIEQMLRCYGPPPADTRFVIMRNEHDAGIYYDIGIIYKEPNDINSESIDYALNCEQGAYTIVDNEKKFKWDEVSIDFLTKNKYALYNQPKIVKLVPLKRKTA